MKNLYKISKVSSNKEILFKIPKIPRIALNFQELRFQESEISKHENQMSRKLTKYQEKITDKEVTLSKIPRISFIFSLIF